MNRSPVRKPFVFVYVARPQKTIDCAWFLILELTPKQEKTGEHLEDTKASRSQP